MKISVQLDWRDYLKAQYLHMRPTRSAQVMLYIPAIILIASLAYGFGAITGGAGAQIWTWLLPVAIIGGLLGLYYYVLLPWNVRRIFAQQKELAAPMEHEITPAALISTSQYGSGTRPWGDFHKWKENQDMLLLYLSDIMFVLIPKRFCTTEQVEAIRGRLLDKKIPQRSKNPVRLVVLAVYFIILVLVGLVVYLNARSSMP